MKLYPIRLRDDWDKAFTGSDGHSEIPTGMTEEIAKEFLSASFRFYNWEWRKGEDVVRRLMKICLSTDFYLMTFAPVIAIKCMPHYCFPYFRKKIEQGITDKSCLGGSGLIASREELSFLDALSHWVHSQEAQCVQIPMLHMIDGLDLLAQGIPKSSRTVDIIKQACDETGLADAIRKIRELVPYETSEEQVKRKQYQHDLRAAKANGRSDYYTAFVLKYN